MKDIQCKNVLVLGNGFDIHHGMKTKYSDYIDFIKMLGKDYREELEKQSPISKNNQYYANKLCQKSNYSHILELSILAMIAKLDNNFIRYFVSYQDEVKGWIDFETLVKKITFDLDKILKVFIKEKKFKDIKFSGFDTDCQILLENFDKLFVIYNHRNPTVSIKEEFLNPLIGINKKEIIKALRKEFDGLCESLWVYLEGIEPGISNSNRNIIHSQLQDIKADAVVTFNYTNTWERYGVAPENVIYIHGSLDKGNIVLGFDDDNEEDLTYLYFKKYMQCILKKTPILENYYLAYHQGGIDGDAKPTMHFFGHSLDVTDREKLLYLFQNANEVKIYYYDEEDHEEKIEKVIHLLGKREALSKFYSDKIIFLEIEKENG